MGVSSFASGFTKVTALAPATVTATTGSPTIDTTSRPGKTIYKFTGSGTITVGTGGTCEYLVIGGGENNGAGGYVYTTSGVLPAGTLTVTVGAGANSGSTNLIGNFSKLGDVIALFGGKNQSPNSGATGGGSNDIALTYSALLSGAQGFAGGTGRAAGPPAVGGGGGAGGVGGNAPSTSVGGNGGAGAANSITGSSVTYAAGGGGSSGSTQGTPTGAGAANTGNGGNGAAGGSGFVVVVIG